VRIHQEDEETLARWQSLPSYGRKTYGTIQAPSSPLMEPSDDLPDFWKVEEIDLAKTEYAYKNFAVIVCEITELEWLHLQRSGHQRVQFRYEEGDWKGSWIVP